MKIGDKVRRTITAIKTSKHGVPTVYLIDGVRYTILPEDMPRAIDKLRRDEHARR